MNSMLKRIGGSTLAVTLLAAVMFALFPAVAEAQTEDKSTPAIVVRPGDSLWSITEERLGPNATPQRVANAAERLHALNRDRIGADPDLIFVGQELLVPPALSELPPGATPARKTTHASQTAPRTRAAKETVGGKAPSTALGGADAGEGKFHKPTAAPVEEAATAPALPDVAAAAPVPAVASLAPNDSPTSSIASFLRTIRAEVASAASALAESFFAASADARAEGRRLLGLGVLVLTLLVAGLLAWKLPMRRTTRRDAERWETPAGYYGETPAAHRGASFGYHLGSPGDGDARERGPRAPEQAPGRERGTPRRAEGAQKSMRSRAEAYILRPESGEGVSPGNHEAASGDASAASRIRKAAATGRGRAPKAKKAGGVARNCLALGAHNPRVRRAPLMAYASMRAARRLRPRRLRPRRIAGGQTKGVGTRDGR